jgi:adenine/guanine phosphoribosyltransferase-like PRPP-binding protein
VAGYAQCFGCKRLFEVAPESLFGRVVPMSTVINPSLWYGRLINYKNGSDQDHTLVSALIAAYLTAHESRIAELLGGAISRITVVPSTRGRRFAVHPLARAVQRSRFFGERLVNAVTHRLGEQIARQEYKPSIYAIDGAMVAGERVVLIEDLWVSGARAVSAAGGLLEAGAASVVILPIAREIRTSTPFCPEEYVNAVKARYAIDTWPR